MRVFAGKLLGSSVANSLNSPSEALDWTDCISKFSDWTDCISKFLDWTDCIIDCETGTLSNNYNHDFKHSVASIESTPNLFLLSVIVSFEPENSLSGSADIAGMDKISMAIKERLG